MDCLMNNQMSKIKTKRLLEISLKDNSAMRRHTDVLLVQFSSVQFSRIQLFETP